MGLFTLLEVFERDYSRGTLSKPLIYGVKTRRRDECAQQDKGIGVTSFLGLVLG